MRKSQIESKLDQDLHCDAKAHVIEPDMIDKNTNNNKQRNDKLGDEEDFELSDAQSSAKAVKLIPIR